MKTCSNVLHQFFIATFDCEAQPLSRGSGFSKRISVKRSNARLISDLDFHLFRAFWSFIIGEVGNDHSNVERYPAMMNEFVIISCKKINDLIMHIMLS